MLAKCPEKNTFGENLLDETDLRNQRAEQSRADRTVDDTWIVIEMRAGIEVGI